MVFAAAVLKNFAVIGNRHLSLFEAELRKFHDSLFQHGIFHLPVFSTIRIHRLLGLRKQPLHRNRHGLYARNYCDIFRHSPLYSSVNLFSQSPIKQNPQVRQDSGVLKGLARQCPTFTGNTTNYHRPKSVSLSCSEWEGVVPLRYGRRAKGFDSELTLFVEFFAKRSKALRAAFAVFMSFILIKPSR